MTDLIAQLEATDSVAHSDVCGCPGWFPPEYTTCRIAVLLENLPAILRALKVQQAAEAYVNEAGPGFLQLDGGMYYECCHCPRTARVPEEIKHTEDCLFAPLVRAVKGVQP